MLYGRFMEDHMLVSDYMNTRPILVGTKLYSVIMPMQSHNRTRSGASEEFGGLASTVIQSQAYIAGAECHVATPLLARIVVEENAGSTIAPRMRSTPKNGIWKVPTNSCAYDPFRINDRELRDCECLRSFMFLSLDRRPGTMAENHVPEKQYQNKYVDDHQHSIASFQTRIAVDLRHAVSGKVGIGNLSYASGADTPRRLR